MKSIFLFIFYFLFLSSVSASEHLDLVPIDGVFSSQYNLDNGSYFSSNQKKYYMDGKIVYCVEPGAPIYTNGYYASDISFSSFSNDLINKIGLIGYFGYDYPGHQSDNYFLATQELIWEFIGNNEIHFTTGLNNSGDIINIDNEKNEIMSLVNDYLIKPSFDGNLISDVYGNSIVLVDNNHVLSNYEVVFSTNSVFIDGDRLIINLDNLGSDNIVLKRKKYDDMSSIFYSDVNSQDFMFLRANDVISNVYVDSFIPHSSIHIEKSGLLADGYDGDFIYSLNGLDDVRFNLYASQDIYEGENLVYLKDELVQEMNTVSGKADSILLPNGDYYLKEVETVDEFILDDSVISISLNNDRKEVYTYMVDLLNNRKRIFISLQKNGEVFDGISSDSGVYGTVPLAGVKFGLYSTGNIFNKNGDLIISKDTLIREFVTDTDGYISEELSIPFGTYYLKELDTLPGYKLDNNIYEFSVGGNDDIIKIMVTREPIINEMIKSRLVINKIDSFGNKLSGCGFKLFDSNDNLIYEGITDSNGLISINDLGYGKYYFYEVSAPSGYILDDSIYEVIVNHDNDLIEVSVMNNRMPVTSDIYSYPKRLSAIGLGFGLLTLSLAVIYENRKSF